MCVAVLALPHPDTPTSDNSGTVHEPVSLANGEPTASAHGPIDMHTSSHAQDSESPSQNLKSLRQDLESPSQNLESLRQVLESPSLNLESLRQTLSTLRLKQEQVRHHTKFLTLQANQNSFPKGFRIKLPVQVPDFENSQLQTEILSLQTEIGTRLRDLVLEHYKSLTNTIETKIESTKKSMFNKAEASSLSSKDKQRLTKIIENKITPIENCANKLRNQLREKREKKPRQIMFEYQTLNPHDTQTANVGTSRLSHENKPHTTGWAF